MEGHAEKTLVALGGSGHIRISEDRYWTISLDGAPYKSPPVGIESSPAQIETMKYRTIIADPPWEYGAWAASSNRHRPNDKSRPLPYPTMTVTEICDLPVSDLADDNCELYLWTTNRYLPDSFSVIEAWGFKYSQTLTWCKRPRGTGQGGLFCPTTEFLILARQGAMPQGKARVDSTWWQVKRPHNAHSKKPAFFYKLIESVSDAPRLELFARPISPMFPKMDGWHTWGNEMVNDAVLTNA